MDDDILHLKVELKLLLNIPCCRFNTRYFFIHITQQKIYKKKQYIYIYKKITNSDIKPEQITFYYGETELYKDEQISTYNIYNYSTITTDINYNLR